MESLHLGNNEIKDIVDVIVNLSNLQSLDLSGNQIQKIPKEIADLSNLQSLDLSNNKIQEIPIEFAKLSNLQSLNLSSNQIQEIPRALTRLHNLQSLELMDNQIDEIPESIARLSNLQSLDLDGNQIQEIPRAISHLFDLQSLYLRNNQIQEIPEALASLSKLQSLDLSRNQIQAIPEVIASLSDLQSLNLSRNQIQEIPEVIVSLSKLQSLNLSRNQIQEIPEAIASLSNLQSLNLNGNQIQEIPETIASLSKLQTLDLCNNKIQEIPEVIDCLMNLRSFYIGGNSITNPPPEIVKKGLKSIIEYFRQLKTEGVGYLYEAKLLIIGEGGAGKTTLANKIKNTEYDLQQDEDSTRGIEVTRWTFPRNDGKIFKVNIWDFGGQEIYHATHQYFLTKRSLYLLVADTRKEDTDFFYWLNVVEMLSDNSPILIVKNEKQDRLRDINITQLRSEFKNLGDILSTNLATNRGLENLLETLKFNLNQLPHIGSSLPETWVKVRIALESDSRDYITLEEYLQICISNEFKQDQDALQLSDYLHDLGICLHFQDDPTSSLYKIVILKPKWGTDAAYAVLDNKNVIRNFGRFTHQDLNDIWNAKKYRGMHGELLELMKKFQLCYELPNIKGTYIAPQLLIETQHEYDWDDNENLILRYTYDFMPKGIVRQFIVALHQNIEEQNVWRSGVIIHKQEYSNTRAEVIENYGKREIKIRVSGKNKRDLLTVVTHELDKIHNSYKRLKDKYQKLIPCNCNTCKGIQNPHFYEFANLKRRYANRKYTVECDISYENVDVLSLIDDVGEKSNLYARDEDRRYDIQPQPSVNIYVTQNQEQNMSNPQTSFGGDYVRGNKFGGDNVGRDKIGTQINNSPNLAQAAKEIKELLDQLSEEYNPNTEKGQNSIKNEALKVIKSDSTLQQKIVNALKEGSVTTLEEAINHPVAKVVIATVKGFLEG